MMRRIDYVTRAPLWPVAAVCLALSAWPLARPRPAAYEVHRLPIHNVAAATFGPSDSELTLVIPHSTWTLKPTLSLPATLEVVDFRTGETKFSKTFTMSNAPAFGQFWASYIDSGGLLIYCDQYTIHIFGLPAYAEEGQIAVGGPIKAPGSLPAATITHAAFSSNGRKFATLVRVERLFAGPGPGRVLVGDQRSFGVRLFDLGSRKAQGGGSLGSPGM